MGLFMPVYGCEYCRSRNFCASTQGADPLERDQKRAKTSPLVLESYFPVRGSRSVAFTALSREGRRQLGCDP